MSIIDVIDNWKITPEIAWQIVCMKNYKTGIEKLKAYNELINK